MEKGSGDGDGGNASGGAAKSGSKQGTPPDKAQRNFTDPESRIMLDGATKSFVQAYNAQVGVDSRAQVIVAAAVTQNANDKKELVPLLEQVEANTGEMPTKASADSGYFGEAALNDARVSRVDLYVPPDRHRHAQPPPAPRRTSSNNFADRMRRKVGGARGSAIYRRRKAIVEPVIGQIKEARGFRRFSFRGIRLVQAEWKLICLTHNLLKLFRWAPRKFQLAAT